MHQTIEILLLNNGTRHMLAKCVYVITNEVTVTTQRTVTKTLQEYTQNVYNPKGPFPLDFMPQEVPTG